VADNDSLDACDVRWPLLDGMDPDVLRVYEAWGRTLYLQRQLSTRLMPEMGLHPGQARCVWAISDNDGITQRDLAELLHISRPTLTPILQKLERAGVVEREADSDDQRLVRIRLTAAGCELAGHVAAFHRAFISDAIGGMSPDDLAEFERLLGLIGANLEQAIAREGVVPDKESA
jgi:MarR family transcriptional regulator, organic hydroperoxide resistance regulator